MIVPLINRSAAEFWLGPGAAIHTEFSVCNQQNLKNLNKNFKFKVTAADEQEIAELLGLKLPLETVSFNHSNHRCCRSAHVLTRYKPFPPKSFVYVKVSRFDLAVASPELCFLQMANRLKLPQLVHLGIKLCSLYYTKPEINIKLKKQNGFGSKQEERIPVTSAEKIRKFLEKSKGEYGIKLARQAARYIVDEANSPMEAALATMMVLPIEQGGYGMPRFTMNEPLTMSENAMSHFRYDALRGDFVWKDRKVIAEYNSKTFHMNAEQQAKDADRINAMQQTGYRVIPITYDNVKYFSKVEDIMSYIMEELGRSDLKERLQENVKMRSILCNELVGSAIDPCYL